MGRKPRIDLENQIYHVICRGNNGEYIFNEDSDKKLYMDIVKRFKKKYDFMIFAYCIMDNHAHFIIYRRKDPLSKFMKVIQQTFTQHMNKKYSRQGHIFQGRFKSIPCKEDEYLLQLLYYIHSNPVRAEFEEGVNYKWSSHLIYSRGIKGSIVDTDFIYAMFSDDFKDGLKKYNKYMGTKRNIKSNFLKNYRLDQEIIEEKLEDGLKTKNDVNLEDIISLVCQEYGENNPDVINKKGRLKYISMRKAVVKIATENDNIDIKMLCQRLGISYSTISRIRGSYTEIDELCEEVIKKVREKL
ncbi:MAG: transposase [Firmicutes bacterium]|nr:transposase [Bacillota bacterium]